MPEQKDLFEQIFGMPLFPHLYAIPISVIFGMAFGYYLRGRVEGGGPQKLPPKPKV